MRKERQHSKWKGKRKEGKRERDKEEGREKDNERRDILERRKEDWTISCVEIAKVKSDQFGTISRRFFGHFHFCPQVSGQGLAIEMGI